MEHLLSSESYASLFLVSFLAATVVPLGSEWLLAAMVISGSSLPLTVAVASSGNYFGGVTTYLIGIFGGAFLIRRVLKVSEERERKARGWYGRYGAWTLLLSWLPLVGDPICLVGGLMKAGFFRFSVLVFTGKLVRYSFVAWIAKEGAELMK